MQFLVFIIAYPFLWFVSILPFRILYWISDIVYFIVYYLIGYRKKTVRENLKITLPHLTDKEHLALEKILQTLLRYVYGDGKNHGNVC